MSGEFKGTPGPWTGKDVGICRQDRAGLQIGFIMTHDENRVAECEANAYLIAAAPELLEVIFDLKYKLYGNGNANPKTEAVIAKALGKKQ
ncbi:hypothetical protein KLVA111870_02100 [Klebsiella variicola]|uniref:hypothetical protein n=1 Tax=Klebsiella variicola TaxID=244366 RepID=UPI00109BC106|nr:hypothetical protein [Klebsiella variicola]VGP71664.1 hypothetical protein SB5387_01066 [Klebsiella variicola]